MRLKLLLLCLCLTVAGRASQKDRILLNIGNKTVTVDEFERLYKKNNLDLQDDSLRLSVDNYLGLFINYKLKVLDAQAAGLDTLSGFLNELKKYRSEVAATYLTDISCDKKMLEDGYYRVTHQREACHILIKPGRMHSGEDTLKAYNRVLDLRNRVLNGEDFGELAKKYSHDPSAKNNKGYLGYLGGFQMVFPFENATYETPVGQISMPFRTRFGYHIVYVTNERAFRGEMNVAHIMQRVLPSDGEEVWQQKKSVIDAVYEELQNGADFATLASKYSDDKKTAAKGGQFAWVSVKNMVPEFIEAAFSLTENGTMTPPVKTRFGWHIIKRLGYRPAPSFDEAKSELEQKIRKDPARSSHSRDTFVKKLKNKYAFTEDKEVLKKFSIADTLSNGLGLISFAGQRFSLGDFERFVKEKSPKVIEHSQIDEWYSEYVSSTMIAYEDSLLETNYPEFKGLMQEYYDGILLFNISQMEVWNKAAEDTLGLKAFYDSYNEKPSWKKRFEGIIVTCTSDTCCKIIAGAQSAGISLKDFLTDFAEKGEDMLKVEKVLTEQGQNPVVDYYIWNDKKPLGVDAEQLFVEGDTIEECLKTLEEAKGFYVMKYQEQLERDWISSLKQKYPVQVKNKELKKLRKKYSCE